jgi:hypothetical protein
MFVPFWVSCLIVLFCVLFVCKYTYVLYYCHRLTTQLQLTNISYQYYVLKQTSPVQCYHALSIIVNPSIKPRSVIIKCDSCFKQSS